MAISGCLLFASACHRGSSGSEDADADDAPRSSAAPVSQADKAEEERHDALKLTPADMVKLGIAVTPIEASTFHVEVQGFGQVMGRDGVIQALSEIEVAQIRATQSHAALERSRKLEGTAGADTVAAREAAVRQDAEDRSAIYLAQAKMGSLLGQQATRALGINHALVEGLSAGREKLVRVTLPLGAIHGDATPMLRLARLDALAGDPGWQAKHVWPGPVDAAIPGRSFLVTVDAPGLAEGERLLAYVAVAADSGEGQPLRGALVPSSAMVLTADDAWVYVEHEPGSFSRERLDTTRPLPGGYFVTGKFAAGTRVISSGAGMLLSRELDVSPDD